MKKMNLEKVLGILVDSLVDADNDGEMCSAEVHKKWMMCLSLVDVFLGCGDEIRYCTKNIIKEVEDLTGYARYSKILNLATERFGEILAK